MSLQTVMNSTTITMPPHYHTSASTNSVTGLAQSIFSYNGNVMLAALVSLLVVILFVLILHLYAKWFLAQARTRSRTSSALSPARFTHHLSDSLPLFDYAVASVDSSSTAKGLDPCVISDIPLFVYESENKQISGSNGLECVICLTAFEESDIGRSLPKCKHAFHVECIDMWLNSHPNCPICRAVVVSEAVCSESKAIMDQEVIVSDHRDELTRWSSAGNGDQNELEIIVVENHGRYQTGHDQVNTNMGINYDISNDSSITAAAASDSLPSTYFGCSLTRMLSLSRHHRSESKVFPSSNATELDAN